MRSAKPASQMLRFALSCFVFANIGHAASEADRGTASERTTRLTREALVSAGTADSLAAATLFTDGSGYDAPTQRLALISHAVALAPGRADLVWLNLQICARVDSCDPGPLEARLRALDPQNAAAWSWSILRSAKINDTAAVHRDLLAISNAERFDIYYNPIVLHTTEAVLKVHTLEPRIALVTTIGYATAMIIPPFQPISNACKGDVLKSPEVVQTCRRVASVLRHGDSYLTEIAGIRIAKRVWSAGSAEYLDAVNAKRVGNYRLDMLNKTMGTYPKNKEAESYLRLLTTHRTEQDVILAVILDSGLSPSPPPDWIDTTA